MASIEVEFISAVLQYRDMETPIKRHSIDLSFFYGSETRRAWKWMVSQYNREKSWGEVPTTGYFLQVFPKFGLVRVEESLPSICIRLVEQRARNEQVRIFEEALERLQDAEEDPLLVLAESKDAIQGLETTFSETEVLSLGNKDAVEQIKENYELKEAGCLMGIPWPWDLLNKETNGIGSTDFDIVFGTKGSMKTWFTIAVAEHAYSDCNRRVLFYTREMDADTIRQRAAARRARVPYGDVHLGHLTPEEKAKYFRALDQMAEDEDEFKKAESRGKYFLITSDRRNPHGGGVTSLRSHIRTFAPDLVIVDGAYLMRNDRAGRRSPDWKDMQSISQDLKGTAQDLGIPILASLQEGSETGEVAYAKGVQQDTSLSMHLTRVPQSDGKTVFLYVRFTKARETPVSGFVLRVVPAVTFAFESTLKDSDGAEKEGGGENREERKLARRERAGATRVKKKA